MIRWLDHCFEIQFIDSDMILTYNIIYNMSRSIFHNDVILYKHLYKLKNDYQKDFLYYAIRFINNRSNLCYSLAQESFNIKLNNYYVSRLKEFLNQYKISYTKKFSFKSNILTVVLCIIKINLNIAELRDKTLLGLLLYSLFISSNISA
jgi:hypothetical protein